MPYIDPRLSPSGLAVIAAIAQPSGQSSVFEHLVISFVSEVLTFFGDRLCIFMAEAVNTEGENV